MKWVTILALAFRCAGPVQAVPPGQQKGRAEHKSYELSISGKGFLGNRRIKAFLKEKIDGTIELLRALEMPINESAIAIGIQFTDDPIERSQYDGDMWVQSEGGHIIKADIGFVLPKEMPDDEVAAVLIHEIGHLPFESLKRGGAFPGEILLFISSYVELWSDTLVVVSMNDKDILYRALSTWTRQMTKPESVAQTDIDEYLQYRRFSATYDPSNWTQGEVHARFTPARSVVGLLMDHGFSDSRILSVLFSASIDTALWEVETLRGGELPDTAEANERLINAIQTSIGFR